MPKGFSYSIGGLFARTIPGAIYRKVKFFVVLIIEPVDDITKPPREPEKINLVQITEVLILYL